MITRDVIPRRASKLRSKRRTGIGCLFPPLKREPKLKQLLTAASLARLISQAVEMYYTLAIAVDLSFLCNGSSISLKTSIDIMVVITKLSSVGTWSFRSATLSTPECNK